MPASLLSTAIRWLGLVLLLNANAAAAELRLTPCELTGSQNSGRVSADCGTLQVAENPDDPDGKQLDLLVPRIPALSPEPAADALTIINGGPGASPVSLYVDLQHAFASVLRERDIVLLDQRGTGRSGALDCPMLESAVDTYAEDLVMQATRQCLEGLENDPRYFTTSVAVKDLEALRQVLGYQQWNLYGVSYGTRVAQHYVRRYPQSVRTLIIDGVVAPEDFLGPDIALNAQRTLDALQQPQVAFKVRQTPLEFKRKFQPGKIAGGIVPIGFLDLDVVKPDHWIQFDLDDFSTLADHLAMHLAFRGHVDDDVALDACLAGQTAVPKGPLLRSVATFDCAQLRQVLPAGGDALLGEIPLAADDLAPAAHGASAAHRIYVDAE